MVCATPHLQNEFRYPRFFLNVFNLILSFSTGSQSWKKISAWEVFGRERPQIVYCILRGCSSTLDMSVFNSPVVKENLKVIYYLKGEIKDKIEINI